LLVETVTSRRRKSCQPVQPVGRLAGGKSSDLLFLAIRRDQVAPATINLEQNPGR